MPLETFSENLRSALVADSTLIQGYFMMSLLSEKKPVEIIGMVRELMKPKDVSKERLEMIYNDVHRCGLGFQTNILIRKENWREARLAVATFNYSQYTANPSILDRIVAIDEYSILSGRLELVVAVIKFKVLCYDFVINGKATNKLIEEFVSKKVTPSLLAVPITDPILIWDNINVHKGTVVTDFLENNGWTVWAHPVDSDDMHPWDFADKKQLKRMIQREIKAPDVTVEAAKGLVIDAINTMNREGSLQGVARLPDIWENLIVTEGLSITLL